MIPLPADIDLERVNDLDEWFPRDTPPPTPELPQTLAEAHDAAVSDYAAKRAAAQAKAARYQRGRWWEKEKQQ